MTIQETIKQFVMTNFIIRDNPVPLDDNQSLLETGIIDSTGILELVSFIEEQYQIRIEDEELVPDNLDSISNVVRFVSGKLGGSGDRVQGTG